MSKRFNDLYEEAGRRIYEAQQARLADQNCLSAKRPWRCRDVPETFWDSYCADARAALSSISPLDRIQFPQQNVSPSIQHTGRELRLKLGDVCNESPISPVMVGAAVSKALED